MSAIEFESQLGYAEQRHHTYKNKIVDVEKYDELGSVYLHFFPTIRLES